VMAAAIAKPAATNNHPLLEKPLSAMRDSPVFDGSPLFRQFRLSVVPLTEEQYRWLTET